MNNIYYHKYLKYKKKYLALQKGGTDSGGSILPNEGVNRMSITIENLLQFNKENFAKLEEILIPTDTYEQMLQAYILLNNEIITKSSITMITIEDLTALKSKISGNVFNTFLEKYKGMRMYARLKNYRSSSEENPIIDLESILYTIILYCEKLTELILSNLSIPDNIQSYLNENKTPYGFDRGTIRFKNMIKISQHLVNAHNTAKKLLDINYNTIKDTGESKGFLPSLTCITYRTTLDSLVYYNEKCKSTIEIYAWWILKELEQTLIWYMLDLLKCLKPMDHHNSAKSKSLPR